MQVFMLLVYPYKASHFGYCLEDETIDINSCSLNFIPLTEWMLITAFLMVGIFEKHALVFIAETLCDITFIPKVK